jgi:hypothetical protein
MTRKSCFENDRSIFEKVRIMRGNTHTHCGITEFPPYFNHVILYRFHVEVVIVQKTKFWIFSISTSE